MFLFTASETLFMVSMAMCYFYSYQTYSEDQHCKSAKGNKDVIVAVSISEVVMDLLGVNIETLFRPITKLLESTFGSKYFGNSDEKPEAKGY